MVDRLGQLIGNYRLTRLLGRGGFAEVYLGEHLRLKTQAAIKVLYTALEENDIEGFLREAQTVARLKHPHIVRIFDFDVQEQTPFLVMDYLPNGSIRRLYPKRTSLPLSTIVSYVTQVASALQYAHDEKVIHRDIKPENMLLDRDGTLVLSDFGIAIMAQSSRYQSTQEVAGTAAYMAPEQFLGHPHRASDQYALGIVVYEWLSGDRPFHGTFSEIASQHMFVPPTPLHEKVPIISLDIEQVIHTALAKDPKQRFGSMLEFARAFEQACQVIQLEHKPVVPVSNKTMANQSQQPTVIATPGPIIPLSLQTVSENSAGLSAQSQTQFPSPAKERPSQAEKGGSQAESARQKQELADKFEEERFRKTKEEGHTRKAEEAQVRKARQGLIPSRFPSSAGTRIPEDPQLRFHFWKSPTLMIILALLILGSSVGLYAAVIISSARTEATATATAQAYRTMTAQAHATATAQTYSTMIAQAHATATAQASIPGRIWHTQNTGTSGYLYDVTWSGSQFVAVGYNDTILTSPDGRTWTHQYADTTQGLFGVTWSGSQFVAVGTGGTIFTSPDGHTWTAQNSGTSQALWGVAWSGSQFVAIGYNDTILTSPDGHTWTIQNSGISQAFSSVAWLGSQFMTMGHGTTTTSSNGRAWLGQYSGPAQALIGIVWSGSQFVAVGYNYMNSTILTSPDGRTWTQQNTGASQGLFGVTWSGSQFVAVGYNGTILTSPDGRTWSAQQSSTTRDLSGIVRSGSQFVAVGYNGTILTSPDGRTWSAQNSGTSLDLSGVAWSGSKFVAVGSMLLTSP